MVVGSHLPAMACALAGGIQTDASINPGNSGGAACARAQALQLGLRRRLRPVQPARAEGGVPTTWHPTPRASVRVPPPHCAQGRCWTPAARASASTPRCGGCRALPPAAHMRTLAQPAHLPRPCLPGSYACFVPTCAARILAPPYPRHFDRSSPAPACLPASPSASPSTRPSAWCRSSSSLARWCGPRSACRCAPSPMRVAQWRLQQ